MDLNMTNLWFHGKEPTVAASFSQAEPAAINCRTEEPAVTKVNLGCLGSSETVQTSRKSFQQSNQCLAVPDDGCRLVLGLGPTPNLYSADSHSYGGNKANESATLRAQHCTTTDPGLMLPLSKCSSRNAQPTTASGSEKYSHARKNGIIIPIIDEGSTSAKRKVGGYMLPLLFAPRSDDLCPKGTPPETNVQQHDGTGCDAEGDHAILPNPHEVQLSPVSMTTDCSFAATSDMVVSTTSGEQRSHQRHPKKCRFNGCSKGARDASGLCISHGGGQRCQKPGCNKGAESRTAYCKSHGGGKRCQELGCTKSAEGKTEFCIAHGGGSRCSIQGCTKAARGKSGFCIKHGGGKRCRIEGCTRSAEGQPGLCISHGGGRRCQYPNCGKGAQGSTIFCKSHGGGKRCMFEGCTRGAEGSTPFCKGHGGGKRCLFEGGGVCPKSVHGGTSFCVAHGGGKRCAVQGCTKSARGRSDCCVKHGGGKLCKFDGCDKSAQGSTDFCKAHGGGKRCAWRTGCEKFARGRSGLCAAHATLMASRQDVETGQGRGMAGPSLFSGIVSASSAAGSSMDHAISPSGHGAWSDCVDSSGDTMLSGGKLLIPHQVLIPGSLKSSSSCGGLAGNGREGGASRSQSFGLVVPEGRVHGGGLMSMLGVGGNLNLGADPDGSKA
uniref:WRKY19-like zinc finger domain-containing protein n=1 Tax=Arundo donax TaxID=35708 RepID=A0A0A8Y1X3_ARUDO